MKPGDLVVCNCETDVWYKGIVGMLVGFDHFGRRSIKKGDPLVMYGRGEVIRLARSGLKVIREDR